ncbi:hypothetical protein [Nocardia wallacei]|uniref:hypothetical protein n=1 Tax=Nocardia wallacei TaxID=480035 RepID=UPI00245738A3|nr:hypothetical protein [Nocardia wallacei]
MSTKHEPAQVNPIVQAAADQVKAQKLRSNASTKAKERLRRWGECADQMSLFDSPEVTE